MFALAILATAAAHAAGDLPRPRQLSVADGLPSNHVNEVAEDGEGYLWFATSDGLARYDGTGFRVWQNEDGLVDSFLWSVDIDSHGQVWMGTALAGLVRYDPVTDSFHSAADVGARGVDGEHVWTVAVDREDSVWFGTAAAGLFRRYPDGRVERFMPIEDDPRSLPSAAVSVIEIAPDGSVWVGTRDGVARWTGRDFERLPPGSLPDKRINTLAFEPDGTLWIGTAGGVALRDPAGSVSAVSWGEDIDRRVIQVLARDSSGNFWLDIRAGLGFSESRGGPVSVVSLYSETSRGEVRPYWASTHEDREGGMWLLSNSHALWYVPAGWRRFSIHARRAEDPSTLGNANVLGISPASGGGVWLVGSSGVLDRFDPARGTVERVMDDVGQGLILTQVLEDSRGNVWVGYSSGLVRLEPGTGAVRRWGVDQEDDALPARMALVEIVEAGDGWLWMLSGETHVQARDLEGGVLADFVRGDGTGLERDENIKAMVLGPDGRPWLGTTHGLRRLAADKAGWEAVAGVDEEVVSGMAVDGDTVWVTGTGSLQAWQWDGERLRQILALDAHDGLPMVTFRGVVPGVEGDLWLTSTRGLVRVDSGDGTFRTWSVGDGLPSQDMRNRPVRDLSSGMILAGTPDGLVAFDPAVQEQAGLQPNLVLARAQVRGKPAFIPDRPFELHHSDRDLRVVARLLSFRNPDANHYRFRLIGYDDDWVDVGASGERVFSQLPSGSWRLEVVARNADNLWSQVRTLQFRVAPPWWRTPAAMALFTLCALLLGWWLAHAYRARLKRRHAWQLAEHKRELAEQSSLAKSRFLATLGHEVRTPMTGVMGMSELLLGSGLDARQRRFTESIRDAGEHLLRLLNDALDLARIEAGKLSYDQRPFDLGALLREANRLNAPIAGQRGLEYRSQVDGDVPAWVLGDVGRVRQVLLNLLGNAIKFTERGHVELCVERGEGDTVRFVVADTGPGLNAAQRERLFRRFEQAEGAQTATRYGGSGLGLAICQELAAGMGGKIAVESTPGQGTRFEVELPLPAAAPAAGTGSSVPEGPAEPLSLLLVEDDPTVAEVIGGLLQRDGHAVTHAAHGLAALSALGAAAPDAALLDLDLPGLDGYALARQIRAQGFTRMMIAITARADAEAEPLALRAGFDRFLRKPLTGAMLARALADVVPAGSEGAAGTD